MYVDRRLLRTKFLPLFCSGVVRLAHRKCEVMAQYLVPTAYVRFKMCIRDRVDTFINAIYLYDDKVLITLHYKEGTQTVTFGEATEVASEGNGSDLDFIPDVYKRQAVAGNFGRQISADMAGRLYRPCGRGKCGSCL